MIILALLSTLAPTSLFILLIVLGELSRRLGEVVKRRPVFHWFYIAAGICLVAILIRLTSLRFSPAALQDMGGNTSLAVMYTVTLALSSVIGIIVGWHYWGWLIYATNDQLAPTTRDKPAKTSGQ